MTATWDTTLVSRVYPGGPLEGEILDHAGRGDPITIAAPTVMEVVRGLQGEVTDRPGMATALRWFTALAASGLVEVLSLDRSAAIVAGRLRALHPAPPSGERRRGTKPEPRAGWLLDIQIAACAWTHGCEVATDNRRDFAFLSSLIAGLYPDAPALVVTGR